MKYYLHSRGACALITCLTLVANLAFHMNATGAVATPDEILTLLSAQLASPKNISATYEYRSFPLPDRQLLTKAIATARAGKVNLNEFPEEQIEARFQIKLKTDSNRFAVEIKPEKQGMILPAVFNKPGFRKAIYDGAVYLDDRTVDSVDLSMVRPTFCVPLLHEMCNNIPLDIQAFPCQDWLLYNRGNISGLTLTSLLTSAIKQKCVKIIPDPDVAEGTLVQCKDVKSTVKEESGNTVSLYLSCTLKITKQGHLDGYRAYRTYDLSQEPDEWIEAQFSGYSPTFANGCVPRTLAFRRCLNPKTAFQTEILSAIPHTDLQHEWKIYEHIVEIKEVKINDSFSDKDVEFAIPPGTRVFDAIANKNYIFGDNAQKAEATQPSKKN